MTESAEPISERDIVELHALGIRKYSLSGSASIAPPRPGCLEGVLGNARTAREYLGDEEIGFSIVFAAHLLFYLANNHCFGDGNKRVAWIAAMDVLRKNGLTVDASDDEAERFMQGVVSGEDGRHRYANGIDVAGWLADRLVEAR